MFLSPSSICMFIILIPAYIYLNIHTHFPPLQSLYTFIAIIRKIHSLYSSFFVYTLVVQWSSKLQLTILVSKLLISSTTNSQLTTNSTNYYQLTNYYVDKTKLLFLHRGTTFWYITFHSCTSHLFLKLLLSYYQTTILETEKKYQIIYKPKSTFESCGIRFLAWVC